MASKPTATTVTLKHLAASLAEDNELSKKQAEAILGGLVGNIVKHLKKGERIRIGGLGILQVRKRAARMGRNPATGSHSDQSQQESRLPRLEGTQGSHLIASDRNHHPRALASRPRRSSGWVAGPLIRN